MTASDFRPPWWCRNRHLQTLYPTLFRQPVSIELKTEQLELADGDFIDLVWTEELIPTSPIVVLLHGLEGSIDSPYVKGLLHVAIKNQWQAMLMHFRGCSGRHNRLDRSYHSGDTADLAFLLNTLMQRYPDRPLAAVGISLGGNILLKYLGESGVNSLLKAAMAISVPFDLADGAHALDQGFAKLYQSYLIGHIRKKMQDKFKHKQAPVNMKKISQWRNFFSFDDNVTAPIHGFNGVDDYYCRSSSKQFLPLIRIPTLLLHSKDDPFMSHAAIPTEKELSGTTLLELCENGGHVGFIYQDETGKLAYWAEKRMAEFFREQLIR